MIILKFRVVIKNGNAPLENIWTRCVPTSQPSSRQQYKTRYSVLVKCSNLVRDTDFMSIASKDF